MYLVTLVLHFCFWYFDFSRISVAFLRLKRRKIGISSRLTNHHALRELPFDLLMEWIMMYICIYLHIPPCVHVCGREGKVDINKSTDRYSTSGPLWGLINADYLLIIDIHFDCSWKIKHQTTYFPNMPFRPSSNGKEFADSTFELFCTMWVSFVWVVNFLYHNLGPIKEEELLIMGRSSLCTSYQGSLTGLRMIPYFLLGQWTAYLASFFVLCGLVNVKGKGFRGSLMLGLSASSSL